MGCLGPPVLVWSQCGLLLGELPRLKYFGGAQQATAAPAPATTQWTHRCLSTKRMKEAIIVGQSSRTARRNLYSKLSVDKNGVYAVLCSGGCASIGRAAALH